MWLWQLKNVPREVKIWSKLIGISFIIHMILIGVFIKGYRNQVVEAVLTINTSRPVFFVAMPVKKSISSSALKNNEVSSSLQKKAPMQAVKKEPAQKIVKKTGLAIAKKEPVKNLPVQKKVPQKTADIQKAKDKQGVEKKELKEIQKLAIPHKPPVQELVVPKQEILSSTLQKDISQVESNDSAVLSEQMMPIEYYNLVQTIMVQWRAPYGIQGSPSCRIKAKINKVGDVEAIEVEESSGILMFDIAARSALLSTQMPEWTRGKSFVITFKQ
jgi:hypothetical protein